MVKERVAEEDMEIEKESVKVGLRKENALCQSKWSVGVDKIIAGLNESVHPHLLRILPDFKYWCLCLEVMCPFNVHAIYYG